MTIMTKATLRAHLARLGACGDERDWLDAQPSDDASELWAACDRIDWMLWLAGRCDMRRQVVDLACDFAERALPTWETWAREHAPQHMDAPRRAIAVARDPGAAAYAARAARAAAYAAAYAADAYVAHVADAAERAWQRDRLREVIPWSAIQAAMEVQS